MENERITDLLFEQIKEIKSDVKEVKSKQDNLHDTVIRMEEQIKNKATVISAIIGVIGLAITAIINWFERHQ